MIRLGLVAFLSFPLALVLGAGGLLTPAAALHVVFAVGILPLIFGAMLHFLPVLTRSAAPHRAIAALPFVAQANGLVVVLAIGGLLPRAALHPAATLALALAATLLVWMARRARRALGTPHPGWRWYAAALLCLVLALAAVPLMTAGLAPAALRIFHLHANTLGFIGLAALGTLPVLLPTALGKPDPAAASWLRARLAAAFAGVLLVAAGAAIWPPLAVAGGGVLAALAGELLLRWRRTFGVAALVGDGAVASLAAAPLGFILLLAAGGLHAFGPGFIAMLPASVPAFVVVFLLPLVSGALAQLMPVWRFSGTNSPQRQEMRRRLARCGRLRAVAFLAGGVALLAGSDSIGAALAGCGLLLFAADLLPALRVPRPAR